MTDEIKMLSVSAAFETWMDASRPWWRRWSTTGSVACSQAQVADMMREAWIASANTAERALTAEREKVEQLEKDAARLDYLDANTRLILRSGKQRIRPLIDAAIEKERGNV